MPIKKISRQTGRSRNLVRNVLRDGDGDVFRCRSNILEPYFVSLGAEWDGGCRNGAELWRRFPWRRSRCGGVGNPAKT